jgi:hypothetical protein
MLTTSNDHTCQIIAGNNGKFKPDAVFDYNKAKKGVDLSDQLASYYNSLRRTIKWYKKLIIELICSSSIVNAFYIHRRYGHKNFDFLKFRELIIESIIGLKKVEEDKKSKEIQHILEKFSKKTRNERKRCVLCY